MEESPFWWGFEIFLILRNNEIGRKRTQENETLDIRAIVW